MGVYLTCCVHRKSSKFEPRNSTYLTLQQGLPLGSDQIASWIANEGSNITIMYTSDVIYLISRPQAKYKTSLYAKRRSHDHSVRLFDFQKGYLFRWTFYYSTKWRGLFPGSANMETLPTDPRQLVSGWRLSISTVRSIMIIDGEVE